MGRPEKETIVIQCRGAHVFKDISNQESNLIWCTGKIEPKIYRPIRDFRTSGRSSQHTSFIANPKRRSFHISQLRRYIQDDGYVLDHSELDLHPDPSYVEQPMATLDRSIKILKNKVIPLALVSWNRHALGEATWEREDNIRECYPELFSF